MTRAVNATARLALLSVLAAGCSAGTPAAEPAPSPAAEPAPSAAPGPVRALHWPSGQARSYALELSTDVELGTGSKITARLSSALDVEPVQGGSLLALRFERTTVELGMDGQKGQTKELLEGLAHPGACELGADGKALALHVPEGVSAPVAGMFSSICYALQLAVPADAAATSWEAEEHDSTGRYMARYERKASGQIAKSKLHYIDVAQNVAVQKPLGPDAQPARVDVKVQSSSITLLTSSAGELDKLTQREQLELGTGVGAVTRADVALELRFTGARPGEGKALPALQRLAPGMMVATKPLDFDDAKIRGRSLDEVLSALEALHRKTGSPSTAGASSERDELLSALGALLHKDIANVERVRDRLKADSPVARNIVSALGSAGSVQALDVLVELVTDKGAPAVLRQLASISLSVTEHPSAKTTAALAGLLDDPLVGKQAAYGLGSSSRRMRELGDEAGAAAQVKVLLQKLGSGGDAVIMLRGLGNSGHPDARAPIAARLSDADPKIRAAAVHSLRLYADADKDITSVLERDTEQTVRLESIGAIRARAASPVLIAALTARAKADASPHVRYACVEALRAWSGRDPNIAKTLEQIAAGDDQVLIRDLARSP